MIKTFCIAHRPLVIPLPADGIIVWNGRGENDNAVNKTFRLGEISEDLEDKYARLTGSAGSFAIEALLTSRRVEWSSGDFVSITMYRKFISNNPFGVPAPGFPGMFLVSQERAAEVDLPRVATPSKEGFLVSRPINVRSLYSHYALHHVAQDMLRYTAIAIDLGVITPSQSVDFLTYPLVIPGGIEFGMFPIETWLSLIGPLRSVCFEFIKAHAPSSMDPYQARALSFCNERLGSYLLLNYLCEGRREKWRGLKLIHEIRSQSNLLWRIDRRLNFHLSNNRLLNNNIMFIHDDELGYMHTVTEESRYSGGS